mgnify:CR=1 FL=1
MKRAPDRPLFGLVLSTFLIVSSYFSRITKAGSLSDPVTACAEELMYVYNNLEHTNYSSIDDTMDGRAFRDPHALAFFRTEAHGAFAAAVKAHLLQMARPQGRGVILDAIISATWGNPQSITDPTVTTMMAYFYAHSTGVFTDQAHALGVDDVWDSDYTWTMNAWVQAIVWRYKAGSLSDPVTACAEELMYVSRG